MVYDQQNQQVDKETNVGRDLNVEGDWVNGDKHVHHHYPQTTATGKPLHRPRRDAHFLGRDEALAKLLHDLQPGKIVTLCGPGGIGKSALATEVLWRLAPGNDAPKAFPDGIFFHSFYNQPSADIALEAIARAYGEEPKPTAEAAARRALSGRRALLVLDGAEAADNLRKVCELAGNCGVLITSRKTDDAPESWQDMPPLSEDDAVSLLRAWTTVSDDRTAREICRLAGCLPLAVRLVGFYLSRRRQKPQSYLEWMRASPLAALDRGKHQHESIPVLLHRSLEQVSATARQALALAGQLAIAPLTPEMMSAVLMLPRFETENALAELYGFGLFLPGEVYQITHALIHTYAREKLAVPDSVFEQLVTWYAEFAETQRARGLDGHQHLHQERKHLIYLIYTCIAKKDMEIPWKLILPVTHYLNIQGFWAELIELNTRILDAARKSNNTKLENATLGDLGSVYYSLGQMHNAIKFHEKALCIAKQLEDRGNESTDLTQLGSAYHAIGKSSKAIQHIEQALIIAREIGSKKNECQSLVALGLIYREIGQVNRAATYYEQALSLNENIGDKENRISILDGLGSCCFILGRTEDAINYTKKALLISEEAGHKNGMCHITNNLGQIYSSHGDIDKAITYYEKALSIAQEIGAKQVVISILSNIGAAYRAIGKIKESIRIYEMALSIAEDTKLLREKSNVLGNIGNAYENLLRLNKAISCYNDALSICREIGHKPGELNLLSNLSMAYMAKGKRHKAKELLQEAISIHHGIESIDVPIMILEMRLKMLDSRILFWTSWTFRWLSRPFQKYLLRKLSPLIQELKIDSARRKDNK